MIHSRWHALPLLAALALTGCGGGDAPAGDALAAEEAAFSTKAMAPSTGDPIFMEPAPPEMPLAPSVPRLTVMNRTFVVQAPAGYHRLMEDPDGSGPLPERPITPVTNSPTLNLPAGTALAQVLGAHYRVAACTATVKLMRQGWLVVPKTFWDCNGASATVRLDAPAIARAFALARTFSISPAGTRAAFAVRNGTCTEIVLIDTSAARDRIDRLNLGTTGDCSATRLSLALAGSGSALAIGLPDAPDAQGRPAGAVQVYMNQGSADWAPVARLGISSAGQAFGTSVAFSANAQRLLVGAPGVRLREEPDGRLSVTRNAGQAILFEAPFGRPAWTPASVFPGEGDDQLGTLVAMDPAGTSVTLVSPVLPEPGYSMCTSPAGAMAYPECLLRFGRSQAFALEQGVWRPAARLSGSQVNDPDFQAALGNVTAQDPASWPGPPLPPAGDLDAAALLAWQQAFQQWSMTQQP
ncbi:hypothetical protein [Ramlibacter rhizophilus]|uniref:Lipoprotein n=1 Tax=Ramlibacter rhizophilus TaxID=1781167 RepID=A0A4Z0BSW5_9BURK|nr:hypothetical protein [Ramlibacter rhizophilus]TFZ01520.1 hypothetical protein EZ242_09120 [Ramlibacter rhizophilus]